MYLSVVKPRVAVRLAAGLAAVAAVIALSGCGQGQGDVAGDFSGGDCHAPLACGPMYPIAYYPYAADPYFGYLTPMGPHLYINVVGGRARPDYQPYRAPIMPGYRPPPRTSTTTAKQAAKAPAAKPAAPRPATRK
jgi:hypothetical protein